MKDFRDLYFEVRNSRGKLQALFIRRIDAEEYVAKNNNLSLTIIKTDIKKTEQ